ncbi:MAG: Teichoic acids export ATP-binding protein TagH [Chloroflexi bacterium ADurb.Bin360]|nr:MAG: Teichoic acids export ATP-binding protein TagH [Chloroflexi bacterium ADurb.Bin360]
MAAHLEPEILLVDEVLAVGDAQFQKKCLGKMGDVAQAGRTVLFVSHNMIALRSLCPRAILLSGGVLINTGSSGDVIAAYLETGLTQTLEREWARPEDAPGTEAFKLRRLAIISNGSLSTEAIGREDEFRVEVEYWQLSSAKTNVNLRFYVDTQVMAFTTPSSSDPGWSYTASQTGLRRATCCVPANLLNTGLHRIELLAVQNEKVILQLEDALAFDIVETEARDGSWYGKWPGVVRPKFVWTNEHLG